MPIYEYQCGACGALHEALQRVSDDPLVECPACGAPELRKKVSAVAFRLKGSGWYETDFKSGAKKNLAGDAGEGGDKGAGGGAGKDGDAPSGSAAGDKKGGSDKGKTDSKPAAGKSGSGDSAA